MSGKISRIIVSNHFRCDNFSYHYAVNDHLYDILAEHRLLNEGQMLFVHMHVIVIDFIFDNVHFTPYSVIATRNTSSVVVTPSNTFSNPSCSKE